MTAIKTKPPHATATTLPGALSELENLPDFLDCRVYTAPDGETWTIRKSLRRFLWHDRIHAKAMWRTASALWGSSIENPFFFL